MTFAPENFASYIGAMLESGIRDSESIAIVTAMRFYADENGRVFRTVAEISAASRVSTRTTMDRLAQLVAMQIVERQVASKRGNVYQLLPFEMCASRTSDVRQPQIRSAPAAHQKCEPRTSEVRAPHIRCAPAAHQNHRGSYSGSDVNKNADGDARAPAPATPIATNASTNDADEAAQKLQGHPGRDVLLPIARVAVSILGVCPEVYTLESWFQQRYSLPRIEYGLKQAKQSAFGQFVPMGKIIISAGRWMRNAQPAEYQQGPQAPAKGPETAQPISTPPSEVRKPLTPEETAEMFKELGV